MAFVAEAERLKGHEGNLPLHRKSAEFFVECLPSHRSEVTPFVPICNLFENVGSRRPRQGRRSVRPAVVTVVPGYTSWIVPMLDKFKVVLSNLKGIARGDPKAFNVRNIHHIDAQDGIASRDAHMPCKGVHEEAAEE